MSRRSSALSSSRTRPVLLVVVISTLALAIASCGKVQETGFVRQADWPTTTIGPPQSLPTTTTTTPPDPDPRLLKVDPGWTLTATPKGDVQGYDAPDGKKTQRVNNLYYDRPTSLPVIGQQVGQQGPWVNVRLAPKPNGQTIWLRQEDVNVGKTPWMIVIKTLSARLQLYKENELLMDAAVGVGTQYTPTAVGDFFMAFMQPPESAAYGPWVMVTSGHSEVIKVWQGFPDGILAIHGPIGSDGIIGTAGAHISNGCIRMHLEDQKRLSDVQPGSPVHIEAS